MKFKIKILCVLLTFFSTTIAFTQVSEQMARQELQKRGISETRFNEEMSKRGIDLSKIDPNNAAELSKIEGTVREVIAFLEKENKGGTSSITNNTAPPNAQEVFQNKQSTIAKSLGEVSTSTEGAKATQDIAKSVEKGASLEEAISETLTDKSTANLPPATVYGQHLFRNNSLKLFRTTEDAKPTGSYVLGIGDIVVISIYGTSIYNSADEITKDGYIQPSGASPVGRYYIAGMTIDEASVLLRQGISRFVRFTAGEFKLSIATARTVNVNIFGEVFNNGSFNISALNTAFNALVAAGGPTDKGSVRNIKLIRPGQKPKIIDIYELINNPSVAYNLYLQENDFIQVPLAGKIIAINGAVNRPFRYELLDNENLSSLLKYAGGLLPEALTKSVEIERVENGVRKFIDVNYEQLLATKSDFNLLDGDKITIKASTSLADNRVFIQGGIKEPMDFVFIEGMRMSDILSKVEFTEDAIIDNAYFLRYNDDQVTATYKVINLEDILNNKNSAVDILLQRRDRITIRSKRDFVEAKTVAISGAVRIPGEFPLADRSLKVSDLVFLAGGLQEKAAAFAYIIRKEESALKTQEYIYVDLKKALSDLGSSENRILLPNDELIIYSAESFVDQAEVRITGAVRKPTQTLFHPAITLKEMILLAEGLKDNASQTNIDIFRVNYENDKKTTFSLQKVNLSNDEDYSKAANIKLMPNDLIVVRYAPEFKDLQTVQVQGEVVFPGTYALTKRNMRITDVLEMSGGISQEAYPEGTTLLRNDQNVGFIIFDLYQALKSRGSYQDIILQPGDVIEVPRRKNVVSLLGATNYQELYSERLVGNGRLNFAYTPGKSAKFYVDTYGGGFDEKADRKRLTVEHPNGKVDKTKSFLAFKTYPKVLEGSVIKVPFKKDKPQPLPGEKADKEDVDWGQVLKDSILQATSILSLILLLRAIN
ncbi:MAG TPA: SLBB domain-containing protein [Saprospiraceae bacterium]|nr:SLBB domain-containing protein [Saprospiraceae bacterium]